MSGVVFIIAPLAVVLVMGLLCLNVWIGFKVGDLTEDTGFDAGFYMMTVVGLTAAEVSAAIYFFGEWFA